MTDNRRLELMQEALDDMLTPEENDELNHYLKREPAAAREYRKLQQVEHLLETAPHERAPERLARTIMARLGQTVMELEKKPDQNPEITEATLRVAVALVGVATLPLMVGASWMLLNAMTNPEAFEAILVQ